MSVLACYGGFVLFTAFGLVVVGVHIPTVAPAERRNAWVTFTFFCAQLAMCLGIWWVFSQLSTPETPLVVLDWWTACLLVPLLMGGTVMVRSLIMDLRQLSARRTPSMEEPSEAGDIGL
jgi:hypothetical protein